MFSSVMLFMTDKEVTDDILTWNPFDHTFLHPDDFNHVHEDISVWLPAESNALTSRQDKQSSALQTNTKTLQPG